MEGDYTEQLGKALESKARDLDTNVLPLLREHYKLFQSAYQGIYNVLMKKGLIHEDPYKYDSKISEVSIPPESPFSEAERTDQMSVRMSTFDAQLDFLINFYQFSAEFLTMGRIKRLLALTRYFNFLELLGSTAAINTKNLADMIGQIRKGSDQLSVGIINDALSFLDRASRDIFRVLKDLTLFQKERYKFEVRANVMPGLSFDRNIVITHRDDAVQKVKKKFSEAAQDRPFYPELIEEILVEDYSSDEDNLRTAILKELEVKQEKKKATKNEISFKAILLDGVRMATSVNYQLDDANRKLGENSTTLEHRRNSIFRKIRKFFVKLLKMNDELIYEVTITDPLTQAKRSEKVDFHSFSAEVEKKSRLYAGLNVKANPLYKKLEGSSEYQVFQFLEKCIEELQTIHRRMTALDTFYRAELQGEDKAKLRGIRIELSTIKNSIIKANQKKYEYIDQKEELEQMKKLGIKAEKT